MMRSSKGFSLLEMLAALILLTTIFFTASSLFLYAKRTVADLSPGTRDDILIAYEEIATNIARANQIVIYPTYPPSGNGTTTGPCIRLRIDTNNTPLDYTNDTKYTYWQEGTQLKRTVTVGAGGAALSTLAKEGVTTLTFTSSSGSNQVNLYLVMAPPDWASESFETTIVSRCQRIT